MKGMKMLKSAAALIAIAALTAQCSFLGLGEEEDDNSLLLAALALTACNQETQTLSGQITGVCTLGGDGVTVTLTGTATVQNGAVLNILPGTTVKASTGAAIYVLQGGKIFAEGTASQPIVFTSSKDVGSRAPQDWGGIIIVGNAPISETSTLTTEDDVQTPYGGTNAADNSGTLKYVRVEFGSYEFATNKEWNSYSFYAVGSGTTLQYLQSLMAADDAFEFFGGRANASFLLSVGTSDDDVDLDEGYQGTITNVLVYRYPASIIGAFSGDPRGMELDGGKGTATASTRTIATIQNFSFIGAGAVTSHIFGRIRDCANITLSNGVMVNFNGALEVDDGSSDCTSINEELTWSSIQVDSNATISVDAGSTNNSGAAFTTGANITSIATTQKLFTGGNEDQRPTFNTATPALGGTDWTLNWSNWRWN